MIILNEKAYAQKCLEQGITDKNPYQVIGILAKYYAQQSMKKRQVKTDILHYLQKHYPRYELNEERWLSAIDTVINKAANEQLFEISGVKITKSEINTIKNIKNKTLEKLAFTSLCLAKLNNLKKPNNNSWVNIAPPEVFKLAHIPCSAIEQSIKLNKLYILGLVEFPKKNGNLNYRITFVDDNDEEELFISDFRELGFEYLNYCGEKFFRCAECGVLEKPNSKAKIQKYCKKHRNNENQTEKTIFCVDCGKPVEIASKDNQTNRCLECYEIYRKKCIRKNVQKLREKQKCNQHKKN